MAAANALMDLWPVGTCVIAPNTAYTGVAVRLRELHERGHIEDPLQNHRHRVDPKFAPPVPGPLD